METAEAAIEVAPRGDFSRPSCRIALVGPMGCEIAWAAQAIGLRIPANASREVVVYGGDNLAACELIAFNRWREDAKAGSAPDWLLVWPNGAPLRWDALIRALECGEPVARAGGVLIYGRQALLTESPPDPVDLIGANTATILPSAGEEEIVAPIDTPHPTMAVCIPSLGRTSLLWVAHVMQLDAPLGAACTSISVVVGYPVDEARERLVAAVLAAQPLPAYLLFLGDDMLPSPNGARILMDTMLLHDRSAVSGLYYGRTDPPPIAYAWRQGDPGPLRQGADFTEGDLVEIDGCGLDFCLIRTKDLDRVAVPRFKTVTEAAWSCGEDGWFWSRWREAGNAKPLLQSACRVHHYDIRKGQVY